MLTCPNCKATHIVKYGKTRSGTQNYKCRECGRRFVEHPTKKYISQETWAQIDKLLKEKLPLSGILGDVATALCKPFVRETILRAITCKKREVVLRMR